LLRFFFGYVRNCGLGAFLDLPGRIPKICFEDDIVARKHCVRNIKQLADSGAKGTPRVEYQSMAPQMQRAVGQLGRALGDVLQSTADSVGKGDEYAQAMREYASSKAGSHSARMLGSS
jgi:hypothetical protein